MSTFLKYSKSIGKTLSNAASTIRDDEESYQILQSLSQYIGCKGFVYEKEYHEIAMRTILLKMWSRLLLMLKTASSAAQDIIFTNIRCIMNRAEFLLENCGYEDSLTSIEEKVKDQLLQYVFLLKLSLLYTPRAIVTRSTPAHEFVFTTISASIIRIPEYRVCFLTQLQGLIQSSTLLPDAGIEEAQFSPSSTSFIVKYLDPLLLKGESVEESTSHFNPHLLNESSRPIPSLLASSLSGFSQASINSEVSDLDSMNPPNEVGTDKTGIDIQAMISNLPPAYTLKNDMIVFHEDSDSSKYEKKDDYCFDDHNFDIVSIDDDHSENPYSTMNIQDILRSQRYSNTTTGSISSYTDSLPPLKLPNMNVVVDMMYEKYTESMEDYLRSNAYINSHPSLFNWDGLCKDQVNEEQMLINQTNFKSNDEVESPPPASNSQQKEIIGDLYLDTQVIALFGRSKALLAQFITFYMNYIRSFHESEDVIVWPAIPGYFLLMRLFLINFQEFFMSKLSSGILRINLAMEGIIKDSIAYSLCDSFVVDGEILNYVMTILFDKCNVNVFLDISKCLMVLHNLLKAIRASNTVIYYHEYSWDFYQKVYSSPEIQLLLQLQELNKNALLPTAQVTHLISPDSPIKLPNSPHLDGTDLDLSTFDSMSHANHYYNDNLTFIYTSTNALDLLYETSIDSTIRWKSTRPSKPSSNTINYSLHKMPSQWMKRTSQESPIHKASSFQSFPSFPKDLELDLPPPLLDASLPSIHEHEEMQPSKPQETLTIQNCNFLLSSKIEGFTLLQAIQFLLDHDIISSRGEGIDFLSILQDRRIIEPILYERRFKTTVYHIIKLQDIHLFQYPEISKYNHSYFEDKINYVYFIYVLKGLIKMPHVQLIQKILSFIYYNEDFFNGKHRLQLYREIIFPNFAYFFTHWNPNVRHIFHRLCIYKLFRTRLSYLPRYSALEIENELYNRIFEHRKEMRKRKESILQEDIKEEEDENNVFTFDKEGQQRLWNHFDYNAYTKSQSSRVLKQNTNKMMVTLQLSEYRETQSVDLKLAELMKAHLHMLFNVNQGPNKNTTNGRSFVPQNQLRYYWTSLLEYISLLGVYERNEAKSKPHPIYTENIYNDGVGNVADTDIPWTLVNEMESRVVDPNRDVEFFLAHKN